MKEFAANRRARSPVVRAYALVNDPSTDSIISWSESGKSFIIWNLHQLSGDVLLKFMGYSRFVSFTITLKILGIRKVEGSEELEYADESFVRGKPELIDNIYERITTGYHNRRKALKELVVVKQEPPKELKNKVMKKKKKQKTKKAVAKELSDQLQQHLRIS